MEEVVESDAIPLFQTIPIDEPLPAREEDPKEYPKTIRRFIEEEPLKGGIF